MVKKILLVLICLISLVIFVSTLHGQGSKKITLPSGEEVWDLNGEWDTYAENYGRWAFAGSYPSKVKITQTGSSFEAIRTVDTPLFPKGGRNIWGELDKSGFKKLQIMTQPGPMEIKGQISEDGNKIVVDDGEKVRVTYTRK